MKNRIKSFIFFLFLLAIFSNTIYPQNRPPLFLREDWTESPAAIPMNQDHVANPDLILNLYGSGKDSLKKSHHDKPVDDPYYVWSGLCLGNWAVTLKHKSNLVDLTGLAKIKWRSKQSGFRALHILVKLADGTWLVSKQADDSSNDWRVREFIISDIEWRQFNCSTITEEKVFKNPDLSKVDEIGFTDLMKGGKSQACSRLDWVEVYGKPVLRK